MGTMEILIPHGQPDAGDTKIMWDSDKEEEVETARSTFEKLVGKGYAAFKVKNEKGDKGEQIRKFDPCLERMILIPQLRGG